MEVRLKMSDSTRAQIQTFIEAEPGHHFSEIARKLDLAPGQVQYHLRRLRRRGAVEKTRLYGQTHYYPTTTSEWNQHAIALIRRETTREILFDLVQHGNSHPEDVADRIGIARSTLEYHLDSLVEQEIIAKQRCGTGGIVLTLARPEQTIELLDLIEPSLPDRLLDRFERLVDHLLEGA